jgi:hypothetical protein
MQPDVQPGEVPRSRRPRQPVAVALVAGVVVLAVLFVVLLIAVLGRDGGTGQPGTSPTTSLSASATASVSASASATASPSGTPGEAITADSLVITLVDRLTLRGGPGLAGEAMWVLPEGVVAFVIGGPEELDGYSWYQLSGLGIPYGSGCVTPPPGGLLECPAFLGWVAAAGPDGTPWLAPAPTPDCPAGPHDVVSISQMPFTLRLICFGDEELTLRAWWPEIPETEPAPTECPAAGTDIEWLACVDPTVAGLAADPNEGPGRLVVAIDPASGVTMPERGQWLELTGHFDDPAAADCADPPSAQDDPGAAVFNCRLQFVLTAVTPASGP